MNTDELPDMKYRVCKGRDPKTGGQLLRPVVTGRTTLDLSQIVAYAREAGFVRGQQKELEGQLCGFVEAIQDRARAGCSVNVNDWFFITGRLKGTVGDDGRLTRANKYEVAIVTSKNLKVDIDSFHWTRDESPKFKPVKKVKIDTICSLNGKKAGELVAAQEFQVNGRNLAYNPAWGDKVEVSWPVAPQTAGEATKTVEIAPKEHGWGFLHFAWAEAFDEIAPGTPLTFTFHLRGAADAVKMQTCTITARMAGAAGSPGGQA
ncbi:MAG: hypothetical protein ACI4RA_04275 [Kiritimatiellia bacterium]